MIPFFTESKLVLRGGADNRSPGRTRSARCRIESRVVLGRTVHRSSACAPLHSGVLLSRWASARSRSIGTKPLLAGFPVFSPSGAASELQARHPMKPTLIVLALISLAGLGTALLRIMPARASSNPGAVENLGAEPVSAESCVDRYNSLLKSAKAALAARDRNKTVDLLQQAKSLIPACPALQDGQLSVATILSLNTCDSARVREPTS